MSDSRAPRPEPVPTADRVAGLLLRLLAVGMRLQPDAGPCSDVTVTIAQGSGPDAGRVAGLFEIPEELALRIIGVLDAELSLLSADEHNLRLGLYDDGETMPVTGLGRDALERRRTGSGDTRRPALRIVNGAVTS
ncbi:hypothetical protein OEIGOIKO_05791 [Streptomyces chrestomyceticus JCM 4735]|uniref:Uncharacterized protein n=1 Tax=Streptomyces chrestomyceticus JCM 4735 TaxID=1306181 RepID=A0A7U9L001_9ACTN|nr:hypothetical protein [Streptomyces chrestomyceticus]GCD37981.1 hypothetical protein OEIGOIKO_05791 [Streptomyces chrestomyceticus JCM 4735]